MCRANTYRMSRIALTGFAAIVAVVGISGPVAFATDTVTLYEM